MGTEWTFYKADCGGIVIVGEYEEKALFISQCWIGLQRRSAKERMRGGAVYNRGMYTAVVNWGDTRCYRGALRQYSIAVIQDDSVQCNVLIEDDVARWGDTGWCSAALNTLARVICSYYRLSAVTLSLWNVGYIYNCLETPCIVVVLFTLHADTVHSR